MFGERTFLRLFGKVFSCSESLSLTWRAPDALGDQMGSECWNAGSDKLVFVALCVPIASIHGPTDDSVRKTDFQIP